MQAEGGRLGHLDDPVQNKHHYQNFGQVGESEGERMRKRLLGRIRVCSRNTVNFKNINNNKKNSCVFERGSNPTQFPPTPDVRIDLLGLPESRRLLPSSGFTIW